MVLSGQILAAAEEDWELRWAPYDPGTYQAVLDELLPQDVVLEIGAGDLRLARRMAGAAQKIYAIEINDKVLRQGLGSGLPANLFVLQADALVEDFPPDVTTAVLLMRHCTHFKVYAEKLKKLGCRKLITNARWRMGLESIPLQAPRILFEKVKVGWYACWCGGVGFKQGAAELLTPESEAIIHEVTGCPACLAEPG